MISQNKLEHYLYRLQLRKLYLRNSVSLDVLITSSVSVCCQILVQTGRGLRNNASQDVHATTCSLVVLRNTSY